VTVEIISTTAEYDITNRLNENTDLTLTQELERGAFERVVSDVNITMSNNNGLADTIFGGTVNPTTKWEVIVKDDNYNTLFRGHIETPIKFDKNKEWCSFTAFSRTRAMWDRFDETKISSPIPTSTNDVTATLAEFFNLQFLVIGLLRDIIQGIDLTEYATRSIRMWADEIAPTGNNGRWREVNPDMTWKEVIEEMLLYYNAEIYVDNETLEFKMIKRGSQINATAQDIDDKVHDDAAMDLRQWDKNPYDYLHSYADVIPAAPTYNDTISVPTAGLTQGTHNYIMTSIVDEFETFGSFEIGIRVFMNNPPYPFFDVVLNIPSSFEGTTSRKLYRQDPSLPSGTGYRLVVEISGNTAMTYNDHTSAALLLAHSQLGFIYRSASAWHKYNHSTGTWDAPILDVLGGRNKPVGTVLDVRPHIQFTEIGMPEELRPYNPYEVLDFFNRDMTTSQFRVNFRDLFLAKMGVTVTAKGDTYKIGDTITTTKVGTVNTFLVKRAALNLTKEKTELDLIEF
jgi:hypothetical protein